MINSVIYNLTCVLICYLELLVQFLTFKSEPFEQNAINKMEIELPSSDTTKPQDTITQGIVKMLSSANMYTLWYEVMNK